MTLSVTRGGMGICSRRRVCVERARVRIRGRRVGVGGRRRGSLAPGSRGRPPALAAAAAPASAPGVPGPRARGGGRRVAGCGGCVDGRAGGRLGGFAGGSVGGRIASGRLAGCAGGPASASPAAAPAASSRPGGAIGLRLTRRSRDARAGRNHRVAFCRHWGSLLPLTRRRSREGGASLGRSASTERISRSICGPAPRQQTPGRPRASSRTRSSSFRRRIPHLGGHLGNRRWGRASSNLPARTGRFGRPAGTSVGRISAPTRRPRVRPTGPTSLAAVPHLEPASAG